MNRTDFTKNTPAKLGKFVNNSNLLTLFFALIWLACCNIAFVYAQGWLHYLVIAIGLVGMIVIYKVAGLSRTDIGLNRHNFLSGLKLGIIVSAIVILGMLLVFAISQQFFRDPRYHQNFSAALVAALLIEPIKTVLFEELAFRGVLPALVLRVKESKRYAILVSSIAFGFWHSTSSAAIGTYHAGNSVTIQKADVMAAAITFTTLAGIVLCYLRFRSQSLLAPIIVHWSINAAAIMFASLSWR